MLYPRVLIVLSALPDGQATLTTLIGALSHALFPGLLRFALPVTFQPGPDQQDPLAGTPGAGHLRFYEESAGIQGVLPLVNGETHFLLLRGETAFSHHWDAALWLRFRLCHAPSPLLTGLIVPDAEGAQAYLPAIRGTVDMEGAPLGPGLALVNSATPVKTLLAHPALLYGTVETLRKLDGDASSLSILAYSTGGTVFALDRALLWPTRRETLAEKLKVPPPWVLPASGLNRFEQLAGLSFILGTASVRATVGLFGPQDSYPQRLPVSLWFYQRARTLLHPASARMPMFVTAFVDLPSSPHPTDAYLQRFTYLKALKKLPLSLYAGGESERRLRSSFPNTLAYPETTLLPRTLLADGMSPLQLLKRNQWLLLERAAHAYPTATHIAWLDIDVLSHPLCPDACPDFSVLMDDRIHLGFVDGHPDASLAVVPRSLLRVMAREVQTVTQLDEVMKRGFSERSLLRRLLRRHPEFFTLHMLPRKGLLFQSCFDRRLLSVPLRRQLADLPQPIRLPPRTAEKKESEPHA
ncbi:MAG TPA: hypothetical protein PKN45_01950 [Candidatus Limiplasma sp.]|nr:hypothetical protein [Candidatus Limiplasma sp.]